MKSRRLNAIFFDIDDTLFSTTAFAATARRNSIRWMIRSGLRMPIDMALQELKEVINEFSSNDDRHFDRFLQRIPKTAYAGINPAILVASGVIGYHRTKYDELKPYPDAVKFLKRMSVTSLHLGVITAGLAVKQAEKLIRLNLYQYLNPRAIFISDQIGISKPNTKLYLKALHTAGFHAEETIYVGDDPVKDIDPANEIGMITARIRRDNRCATLEGQSRADYEIKDFDDLEEIVKRDFKIDDSP